MTARQVPDFQRRAKELADRIGRIAKMKLGRPKDADQLELALAEMPTVEALSGAVAGIRSEGLEWIRAARLSVSEAFEAAIAEYITGLRGRSLQPRQTGRGWRVGTVELDLRAERAEVRALYNGAPVEGWASIGSLRDIEQLVDGATQKLEKSAVESTLRAQLLWESFQNLRSAQPAGGSGRVKLRDLYREFRVALVRDEVRSAPERRLARVDFPLWAFLYNVDLYIRDLDSVPKDLRLSIETGSQQDIRRGMGMLLNGLDLSRDPMSYCYVYQPR